MYRRPSWARRPRNATAPAPASSPASHNGHELVSTIVSRADFYAHMPSGLYIFEPTGELWPASSVDKRLGRGTSLALSAERAVEQMTWAPDRPRLVRDELMVVSGWRPKLGATAYNLYRPPQPAAGDAHQAGMWREHVRRIFPDDAEHIERWLAHHVQHPGVKVNHALVLGGDFGIGKDTLLEPIVTAVGPWNWSDINPAAMLGRFNGWAKAIILRVNEARDLGDVDRFQFYDHMKAYTAAPPDVLRIDEKNLREHSVLNCCGVIITTNHLLDGLHLPAGDRRHFVAWSPRGAGDFDADYFPAFYQWLHAGGSNHVGAFLRSLDLGTFNPKAPPPKTPAFWQIVGAGESPEAGELRDVIDEMGNPAALTLDQLIGAAERMRLTNLADDLGDRKNRRSLPHRLGRAGYVSVRNDTADDGLHKVGARRVVNYARKSLPLAEQIRAARVLTDRRNRCSQ